MVLNDLSDKLLLQIFTRIEHPPKLASCSRLSRRFLGVLTEQCLRRTGCGGGIRDCSKRIDFGICLWIETDFKGLDPSENLPSPWRGRLHSVFPA